MRPAREWGCGFTLRFTYTTSTSNRVFRTRLNPIQLLIRDREQIAAPSEHAPRVVHHLQIKNPVDRRGLRVCQDDSPCRTRFRRVVGRATGRESNPRDFSEKLQSDLHRISPFPTLILARRKVRLTHRREADSLHAPPQRTVCDYARAASDELPQGVLDLARRRAAAQLSTPSRRAQRPL